MRSGIELSQFLRMLLPNLPEKPMIINLHGQSPHRAQIPNLYSRVAEKTMIKKLTQ